MKRTYWTKRILDESDGLLTETIRQSNLRLQRLYLSTANFCIGQLETIYVKIQNSYSPDQITRNMIYQYQGYYEKLQLVYDKLDKLGNKQNKSISKNLIDLYKDNTKFIDKTTLKPMGIDIGFSGLDKRAEQASQRIWASDGKSWSERLWGDTAKLKSKLAEIIPTAMASGQGVMSMTAQLQKDFSTTYSQAKRICSTELTHIYAVSAQETFYEAGFDEWEWSTNENEKVCEVCSALDGKRFNILDNTHLPPEHPNCQCIVQPVIDVQKMINLEYKPRGY